MKGRVTRGRKRNRWRPLSSHRFDQDIIKVSIRNGFNQLLIKSGLGRWDLISLLAPACLREDWRILKVTILAKCVACRPS
jgi:hypothetical protein